MRTAKTLIRLGGCPGWSESSLGAHSFCWFCQVTAHMFLWRTAKNYPSIIIKYTPSVLLYICMEFKVCPLLPSHDEHWKSVSLFQPPHDKTNKMTVRPVKTQISLGICPVWSESSLCAQWAAKDPSFLQADSEDADQTGQIPRLFCLHWAQMPFRWFCHEAAHLSNDQKKNNDVLTVKC